MSGLLSQKRGNTHKALNKYDNKGPIHLHSHKPWWCAFPTSVSMVIIINILAFFNHKGINLQSIIIQYSFKKIMEIIFKLWLAKICFLAMWSEPELILDFSMISSLDCWYCIDIVRKTSVLEAHGKVNGWSISVVQNLKSLILIGPTKLSNNTYLKRLSKEWKLHF